MVYQSMGKAPAASYLGIQRSRAEAVAFRGLIRYRRAGLDFWIEARLSHQPTGAKGDTNEKCQEVPTGRTTAIDRSQWPECKLGEKAFAASRTHGPGEGAQENQLHHRARTFAGCNSRIERE